MAKAGMRELEQRETVVDGEQVTLVSYVADGSEQAPPGPRNVVSNQD